MCTELNLLERRIEHLIDMLWNAQIEHRHYEGGCLRPTDGIRGPVPLSVLWKRTFRWPWQLRPYLIQSEELFFQHFVICQRHEVSVDNALLDKWYLAAIPSGCRKLHCIASDKSRMFYSRIRVSSRSIPGPSDFVSWRLETITIGRRAKRVTIPCWLPDVDVEWVVSPHPLGISERVISTR